MSPMSGNPQPAWSIWRVSIRSPIFSTATDFERELKKQTKSACSKSEAVCVVQFAVTNLDQIVATLGFTYGDRVRQSIASRLKSHLAKDVTWAAITADVFAGLSRFEDRKRIRNSGSSRKCRGIIGEDYAIDGARISVQLKFGYVVSEGEGDPDLILKRAGNALSTARRDSQKPIVCFKSEMDTALAAAQKA